MIFNVTVFGLYTNTCLNILYHTHYDRSIGRNPIFKIPEKFAYIQIVNVGTITAEERFRRRFFVDYLVGGKRALYKIHALIH